MPICSLNVTDLVPQWHFRSDTLSVPQSVNVYLSSLPDSFMLLIHPQRHHHTGFPQMSPSRPERELRGN